MDTLLFEQLLNESEGTSLDFKMTQYKFNKATDEEKGELLKDILAFTNSWRRTDAYIVIGVKEVKGGPNTVVGVSEHLDDHALQQFVNNKTQEPVTFSYLQYEYKNKLIGIILIPKQKRPIYLKSPYGKLEAEKVYIRRGSSTDIAKPDEIAKMGNSDRIDLDLPKIEVQFADIFNRETLGTKISVISDVISISNRNNLPDFEPYKDRLTFDSLSLTSSPNINYYRRLVRFYETFSLTDSVGFAVINSGRKSAENVRVIVRVTDDPDLVLLPQSEFPDFPRKFDLFPLALTDNLNTYSAARDTPGEIEFSQFGDKREISIHIGNMQPGSTIWSEESIYIGCRKSKEIELHCEILANNLPNPISFPLLVVFKSNIKSSNLSEMEKEIEEMRERHQKDLGFDDDDV